MNIPLFKKKKIFRLAYVRGDNRSVAQFEKGENKKEKKNCFADIILSEAFQTLHNYKLALGLLIHTRFHDLDLFEGHLNLKEACVCQKHRL